MKNKTIDDYPILCEYPFYKKGMTIDEYNSEKEYYDAHIEEVRDGTYVPLWKQNRK